MIQSMSKSFTIILLILLELVYNTIAVELTFELPDSAKQCFHEEIHQGTKSTIEFQVVTGGQYDVDMTLEDPRQKVLYQGIKKQFDTFTWTPELTGIYTICFSNEFSTFSHKLVYFDFQVGEEDPLPGTSDHLTAMTKMEQSAHTIHESLNEVNDQQTHYRLSEAKGRKRAEDLNTRVMWWSVTETCIFLIIGFGQVAMLKSFFSDKKSTVGYNTLS